MSFKRTVPSNVRELHDYLKKIHENKSHVKKVEVNMTSCHLEVSLDWAAHMAGNPDVYLPIKRAKVNDAKAFVEKLLRESAGGFPPSESAAQELMDMLDPTQT